MKVTTTLVLMINARSRKRKELDNHLHLIPMPMMRAVDMTSTQVRAGRKKHQRENVGHAGIRPLNDQGGPLLTSACTPDYILMQRRYELIL